MIDEEKILLLKNMLRVRRMEELCAELYTREKIRGFLHLYIGEEAVATGVMSLVDPVDNVMATYREHAHALLKGISAKSIMAEMFGRVDGCSGGRGGSMHLYSREKRFFGGNAIVASGIPQAVGLALAAQRLSEARKTICFFGEGAIAEGIFYESLNIASLWRIPLLFCCENNLYAMGTGLARSQAQTDLIKKAAVHNISAESVNGMDVLEVVAKTKKALENISNEKKPYFLEFQTYRFRPHSMFDPDLYREKSELEVWKKHCPIDSFSSSLLSAQIISEDSLKNVKIEIENEMQEAIVFAEKSLEESVNELERHVYFQAGI